MYNDPEDSQRNPFQRDRDRIVHTKAFRRLKGKTQVFATGEGDHYRTRLTHTLEVSLISRDAARFLGLNEDLAECIALAHDIGHPPFGHAGEEAINEWMQQFGKSFEHNLQSHRIVTLIEKHSNEYPGLNLNREVLDGLLKHCTPHDHPDDDHEHVLDHAPSLEAQLTNLADEVAYSAHDLDDGMTMELFTKAKVTDVPLAHEALTHTEKRGTSLRGGIIELLLNDLYQETDQRLDHSNISSLSDVYNSSDTLVSFSPTVRGKLDQLRSFLWENMYLHPTVLQKTEEGTAILVSLLNTLHTDPSDKVLELQRDLDCSLEDAVKDYVARMTERYAREISCEDTR